VAEYLGRHGDRFDIVWVCRTHNFRALRRVLVAWRNAAAGRRLVVDTEAVESLRDAGLRTLVGLHEAPGMVQDALQAELPELWAVDKVVTVNAVDAAALRDTFGLEAAILGHVFDAHATPAAFEARHGIAFLGALYGTDTPNYDSLQWFIEAVFPLVQQALPDVRFHIGGYVDKAVPPIESALSNQIIWHGEVADLAGFFDDARIFVAPTRYAGGIPHKVQNAAAHGLPAIVTPLLAAQLEDGSGETFVLAPENTSAAAFADCVIQLYRDRDLWTALRGKALRHVANICSPEFFNAQVMEIARGG
jgi:hypothetical protein